MKRKLDREKMCQMFMDGYSYDEIANETGAKSVAVVKDLIRACGIRQKENRIDVGKAKALRRAGWTIDMIVNEFGYNFTAKEIEEALAR